MIRTKYDMHNRARFNPEDLKTVQKALVELSDSVFSVDRTILDFGEETYSYGVLIDWTNRNHSVDLQRIGNKELHKTLPVQSQYKGCIWDYENERVLYYLNPDNWNLAVDDKINGVKKTAEEVKEDMLNPKYGIRVETPKFYASSKVLEKDGYGNTIKAKVMFSTQKVNSTYIEIPKQTTDFRTVRTRLDGQTRKLVCTLGVNSTIYGGYGDTKDSITNHTTQYLYPFTNLTRGTAREWAHNNNTHLMCYEYYKWLIYWAFVIEYATTESCKPFIAELNENGFHQGGLGGGVTALIEPNGINVDSTNTAKDTCRYIGVTNELGNNTGELNVRTDNNTKTGHPNRYRGFECPFGDFLLVLDGFLGVTKKDCNKEYYLTCDNPDLFKDEAPKFYDSEDFQEGWRVAFSRDLPYDTDFAMSGYDEGAARCLNIGEYGDLFATAWFTDSNSDYTDYNPDINNEGYEAFFCNYNYPIDGIEKSIIYVGSRAGDGDVHVVGLGGFDAYGSVSRTGNYLGFRCFNIIND